MFEYDTRNQWWVYRPDHMLARDGQHVVRARTVGVLKEGSESRNSVDIRCGVASVAKRRLSGTTKHAAISAFSMEEDDIGLLHIF